MSAEMIEKVRAALSDTGIDGRLDAKNLMLVALLEEHEVQSDLVNTNLSACGCSACSAWEKSEAALAAFLEDCK